VIGRVLVLVVLAGCGREATAPPGAEGGLGGVWIGTLDRDGETLPVALWVEEDGERLAGAGAQLADPPPPFAPVSAPAGLACDELERTAPGTIRHRISTDLGADVEVVVSLDDATHTLVGTWVADSDVVDESGDVVLTRSAWLPTREQDGVRVPLGCVDRPVPECADGIDNDSDGLADADDPACCAGQSFACALVGNREAADPSCADGLDNDGDGAADDGDAECGSATSLEIGREPVCSDGWDNDGDGLIDLADDGCGGDRAAYSERGGAPVDPSVPGCANGFDDDGDGLVDLADPSCHGQRNRGEAPIGTCDDGIDNDGDGVTDLETVRCTIYFPRGEAGQFTGASDCADGLDNDGDGGADTADADCFWFGDGDEVETTPFPLPPRDPDLCVDDVDEDGDARVDLADPDCLVMDPLAGGYRFEDVPACENGIDDDRDGRVDADDPDCAAPHGQEVPVARWSVECADGEDNDGDGLVDAADPHCAAPYDWTEAADCANHRDDDGDGLFDLADPGCASPTDDSEL